MSKIVINNPDTNILEFLRVMDADYDVVDETEEVKPVAEPIVKEEPPRKPLRPYFKTDSFRELLKRLGWSQQKFSDETGVKLRTVSNWCVPEDSSNHRDCPQYLINLFIRLFDVRA